MRLVNHCPNISIETIFMNTKKESKMNEPHKSVLKLSQE